MGTLVVHVGELGQGEMLKLINNSLGAANAAAVAEALVLAKAVGVDLDALEKVVGAGSGASAQLELKARPMREHDYRTLFKTEHMLKDVRLCLEEAQAAGVPFPAAAHARDLLTATEGRGHGEDDYAAVIEAAEGLAGRRILAPERASDEASCRHAWEGPLRPPRARIRNTTDGALRPETLKKTPDLQGIWYFRLDFVSLRRARCPIPGGAVGQSSTQSPVFPVLIKPCQLL